MMACQIFLRVQEVMEFGVLMLEFRDKVVWKDHALNYPPCHLPTIDGRVDPSVTVIRSGFEMYVVCIGS